MQEKETDRKKRLAEQLRANLRRRKAQAREAEGASNDASRDKDVKPARKPG